MSKSAIRVVPALAEGRAPAPPPAPRLPVEATPFVGRVADLDAIDALFRRERLVTLTGPGGMGKTRLAIRWAAHAAAAFPGGIVFCDLTGARDARGICAIVQEALGLPPGAGETDERASARIGRALGGRGRNLLVLDNFEQVVAHAPATVGRWVREAPEACALVTSREVLRIAGEAVHELGPLAAIDGATLLVERAARVRRGYAPGDAERPLLDDLVHRVDGIPLAIELLAARMALLDAAALRERLVAGGDLLSHGARDATAQRRTLRATIEGSLALLSATEARALAWLSVFRGGFDVALAEAMLGGKDALDVVQGLRDKSLVHAQEPSGLPGALRLGLYAPIAELAHERLTASGEELLAKRRHAEAVVAHGELLAARIEARSSHENHVRLALEEANLVAAIDHLLDARRDASATTLALRAVAVLEDALNPRGLMARLDEVATRVLEIAAGAAVDGVVRARALRARARARGTMGKRRESVLDLDAALPLARAAGDRRLEGLLLAQRGRVRWEEPEAGFADLEAALVLHRETGDRPAEARTTNMLAAALYSRGREEEAHAALIRTRDLFRETGDVRWSAIAECQIATVAFERGRFEEASEALGRARSLAPGVGAWNVVVMIRQCEAMLMHGRAEHTEAIRAYSDVIAEHDRVANRPFAALFHGYRAVVRRSEGALAAARDELVDATRELAEVGDLRHAVIFGAHLAATHAALGELEEAAEAIARAEALLPTYASDMRPVTVLELGRAELELARSEAARLAGDAVSARTLRDAARERIANVERARAHDDLPPGSVLATSWDTREALRLAARTLGSAPSVPPPPPRTASADTLVVHHDGRWFRPPHGDIVDASARHVARRLLVRLAEERLRTPGKTLDVDALLKAGWPGERILAHAAKNRLHVAIATLRRLGLRDVLRSSGDGYLLDPDVPLEIAR